MVNGFFSSCSQAANNFEPRTRIDSTILLSSPVLVEFHVVPPSHERKTPPAVAAYIIVPFGMNSLGQKETGPTAAMLQSAPALLEQKIRPGAKDPAIRLAPMTRRAL